MTGDVVGFAGSVVRAVRGDGIDVVRSGAGGSNVPVWMVYPDSVGKGLPTWCLGR